MLKDCKDMYQEYLKEVHEELIKEFKKNKVKFIEINYRTKHKYSLWKKLLRHDMDLEKIDDIVALRVIVENIEECYRVLGIIHSIWRPLPGRIKDYIAVPKPNGYRSIHTTIFTGLGGTAEIQIRTQEMHNEAAYGIAAHFAYKESTGKKNSQSKSEKFKWIEELKNFNYELDDPKKYLEHLKTDFFNDRIFIFTPKGDVVDLPESSSPIDFAYSIHSDLGNHISGVKVNNKIAPILSTLKNGDIVEIVTKKDSHPSSKWLEYVKTNMAIKNIRSYIEKNSLISKLKSFGRS
jgi:GTP pyrophosphokinase